MGNLREVANGTRNNGDEREGRERRRRKAIEALESLLTRLRGWCQTLERLDQWYELLQEVRQIFHDWEDALPRKARKRLERALGRADRVKENLDLACKALQDTSRSPSKPHTPRSLAFR